MTNPEIIVIVVFMFFLGGIAGYALRGYIDVYREDKEARDFEARIKAQENIPSYPTPTPKLKEAKRMIREYAKTHGGKDIVNEL